MSKRERERNKRRKKICGRERKGGETGRNREREKYVKKYVYIYMYGRDR